MSVLLIHGVGGRARSWDRVLGHLAPELRTQSVAIDVDVSDGQSVAEVARDVMDRHPGSHVIVGHSFGGMLAQEIALIDRARIRGLVLVSTIPGATQRVSAINRGLADDIEARGLEHVAASFAASLFAPGRSSTDPDLHDAFVADMLEAGTTSVCAALRAIADWDATSRVPQLRCPAIVLAGSLEPDLDRQALLAHLIEAELKVIDDVGHLAPWEAPDEVARAVAEMSDVAAARAHRDG